MPRYGQYMRSRNKHNPYEILIRPNGQRYYPKIGIRVVRYHHKTWVKSRPRDEQHYVVVFRTHDVKRALEHVEPELRPRLFNPQFVWAKIYTNPRVGYYEIDFNKPDRGAPAVVFRELQDGEELPDDAVVPLPDFPDLNYIQPTT